MREKSKIIFKNALLLALFAQTAYSITTPFGAFITAVATLVMLARIVVMSKTGFATSELVITDLIGNV